MRVIRRLYPDILVCATETVSVSETRVETLRLVRCESMDGCMGEREEIERSSECLTGLSHLNSSSSQEVSASKEMAGCFS